MKAMYLKNFNWLLIVGCLTAGVFYSCNTSKNSFKFVPSDKFLFIEFIQTTEGKQISGNAPRGLRIDGPSYYFDKDKKEIAFNRTPDFSLDTVAVVIGTGKVLKGAAGSGVSTYLSSIQKLPFFLGDLKIEKIDKRGIHAYHNSKAIFIREGEEWSDSITKLDTLSKEGNIIVELKTRYTLHYWGLIEKKSIKK